MSSKKTYHSLEITEDGEKYADNALESEQFEDPIADLIWYLQTEDLVLKTHRDNEPSDASAYRHYQCEYLGYCGVETPTTFADFQNAIEKGYIEWLRL